jgi:hypothetical protein
MEISAQHSTMREVALDNDGLRIEGTENDSRASALVRAGRRPMRVPEAPFGREVRAFVQCHRARPPPGGARGFR